ncbi:DUF4269 domain-containing protein [Sphingomonas sp. S2-65]|uniref:DUF4269 domain-containing protein n=1 Tax=Sphingomonas sp. S2-65 TaxID=2903960 RepID=UPI001F3D9AC4|nr:DUF4269 domain-containing protein [Sphingomonas sp. S2-65]UYY57119.1 DUF4269 domain-containing protein [Sphingomonas sp. S2-65]
MERVHYLEALERTEILAKLSAFSPHVVGTPPLALDLPTSDIDVICFAPDADAFTCAVWNAFGLRPEFRMWQWIGGARPVVAKFAHAGWVIEIFGQASPISEQFGWRHFLVEQRLLACGGDTFRNSVMTRRKDGMKTEPAFATVLGLDGDPYVALLSLESCSDIELAALLADQGFI